jgi:hypothetical protein
MATPNAKYTDPAAKLVRLPIEDLSDGRRNDGAWGLQGEPAWKKSGVRDGQLSVFYGKDSGTSGDPGVGGMAFTAIPRGLPSREATMTFKVLFEPGWHFSKGGKVGGFFVGHGEASGYQHSPTGSSHRLMWQRGGGAIAYIYPPSGLAQKDPALQPEGHGIGYFKDLFPEGTLKVGTWNTVTLGIRINSFRADGTPRADGVATLRINGMLGVKDDIRWSRSSDLIVSQFRFNTFFGGPDPAVCDCRARYRDFAFAPVLAA